ncbi:hypothetical protein RHSIM_RhsimUnG0132800 [Rhododendron simsii]|uniref:CAF1B/HIR1 beta-propeller domain-containing protein n=1 Tax=Rhododendron simsii TaxID=118357 RepID=A0A834L484_RHOSS|nr:hypothetical protein RHSIM_RhsimUnG0132800 [Rhododendron simsii]
MDEDPFANYKLGEKKPKKKSFLRSSKQGIRHRLLAPKPTSIPPSQLHSLSSLFPLTLTPSSAFKLPNYFPFVKRRETLKCVMRGGTVQINWHDTKPVLTLDFHPPTGILATGGADFDIKLWLVTSGEVQKKTPTASYQNSLAYHGSAVNALRFSPSVGLPQRAGQAILMMPFALAANPQASREGAITLGCKCEVKQKIQNVGEVSDRGNISFLLFMMLSFANGNNITFTYAGEHLASGADGGELVIWKLHTTDVGQAWKVLKTLSFHRKDVLDLQWSSDGEFLVSGSVDNSCIIWDVSRGSVHQILDAHQHYVQGVAWDPLAKYIASLSSDRTCRIYVNKPQSKAKGNEKMNYVCQHVIAKAEPQIVDESKSVKHHLFHDETLPSFFRRLAWSPDGSFLLVPAGSCRISPASEPVNTSYIFSRNDLTRPALLLPGASKPVVAVRFCPLAFRLRASNSATSFRLPHRLVFAVATLNSLYIYDTEGIQPIAILAGLHYAAITDIAWSPSGKYLALSSQDGYCTLVEFENDELGSPISLSEGKKLVGDESKVAVQKPDDNEMEGCRNKGILSSDSGKTEIEKDEGKQPSTTPVVTPLQNKPAKRRITPMAID